MYRLIFLVGVIVATATATPQPQAANTPPKCVPVALPQLTSAFKSCSDSTKFTFPVVKDVSDIPKILSDFEKNSFDDKCFSKCMGDNLKLITPENKLNRAEFAKIIKLADANEEMTKTIDKIWKTCADTVEAKMKDDKNMCKTAAMFATCIVKTLHEQKDSIPKC